MKYIVLFLMFVSLSFAIQKGDVYKAYQNKDYKDACILAAKIYLSNRDDNDFLTVFADSCMKSDYINRMAFPAILLIRNPGARSNSIYFLTILYQKKLLYKSLVDGLDVSKYNFPTTNYILSKIFVKYAKKDYKKDGDTYIFKDDKDKDIVYKMKLIKSKGIYKIVLKTYRDDVLVKKRVYW